MPHLEQQGGWYRIVLRYDGKRFARALDTQNEQEARDRLARVRENLKLLRMGRLDFNPVTDDLPTVLLSDGRLNAPPKLVPTVTLGELLAAYDADRAPGKELASVKTERMHGRHLARVLGEKLPARELPARLQEYINRRAQEKTNAGGRMKTIDPETIRKELRTLSYAWRRAARLGQVEGELVLKGLEWPKGSEKPPFQSWAQIERKIALGADPSLWSAVFLSVPEIEALLAHVKAKEWPLHYAMFAFAAYTGARRAEMMRALLEDVDLKSGVVQLREKKRDIAKSITFRQVPIAAPLRPILEAWITGEDHPGGPMLFCKRPGQPLTPKMADDAWDDATKESRWKVLPGWHCLRHSLASNLASRNFSDRVIMEVLGHLDEETSRRYQHLAQSTTEDALATVFPQPPRRKGKRP